MANEHPFLDFLNNKLDLIAAIFTDDEKWSKFSRRTVATLVLFALVITMQTSIIYSPQILIEALYHGRGVGVPIVIKMDNKKSEKMLQRLYSLYVLYHGHKPVKNKANELHLP